MRTVGKPHFVESVIEDEPVCHCGRRLRKRKGTAFIPSDPVDACSGCYRNQAVARERLPEDDGSTWTESVP